MNNQKIETRVLDIVSQVAPVEASAIGMDVDFALLRLDSVGSMELVSMLCEEFDIDIEMEDAFEVRTVRQAVVLTQRYLDARAGV
jgi:acyl carrier protein